MAESPIILAFQSGLQEVDGVVTPVYGSTSDTLIHGNDARLSAQQVLVVKKNPGAGEYSSVKAAVDSITDASAAKPYQIFVRAGVYVEDTITMKPYVNIRGMRNSTVIEVDDPSKDLIIGTNNSEISETTLRGSTNSGKALVRVSSTAAGDVFSIRDCLFGAGDAFVICDSATFAQVTVISCLALTTADATTGFYAAGVGYNILYVIGFNASVSTGHTLGTLLKGHGPNTTIGFICGGIVSTGGTITKGFEVYDGATLNVQSSALLSCVTGLSLPNTGAGPNIRVANLTMESITTDVSIAHPSSTGFLSGSWIHSKEVIDVNSDVSVFHSDATDGIGVAVLGDILQGADSGKVINLTKLTRESATVGLLTGGALTKGGGAFEVDVAAGNGFLDDSVDVVDEVTWDADTVTLAADQDRYIVVNESGTVVATASITDLKKVIVLGRAVAHGSDIEFIEDSYGTMQHWGNRVEEYLREAIGPIFAGGCAVSENSGTDRSLDVTAGEFYYGSREYLPSSGAGVTFTAMYKDGVGGWTRVASQTVVSNTQYDDGDGTLGSLTTDYYAKHALYLVGDGVNQEYFLVYAQAQYASQGEAVDADLPAPPPFFRDGVTIIASLVVKEGEANFIEIRDERPMIGFSSSSAQSSNDHGSLLGLEDDDHPQYLFANGDRSMTGNLNMGGNQITNVGNVDGVDVSSHAARHLPNGDDAITTAIAAGLDGDSTNTVGIQNSLARSDHTHAIATGVVSSQTPDNANAEGTSANLARADHTHNIPAEAPSANLSGNTTNQEGVALSFARSDHSHAIDTGVVSTQGPDNANAEGSSPNLARADHVHNIPADTAVGLGPDGGSAEGTSSSFARADHTHDLPTAAPTTTLSATTSSEEGVGSSFSRNDHVHAISTGVVTTQTPDQANAEGTGAPLARADHTHNIPTETPATIGVTNAEGTANSFARSDHVHDHGQQTQGDLHAVATALTAGFMPAGYIGGSIDQTDVGYLQYTNSVEITLDGANTNYNTISLASNQGSYPNNFFTKVNATDFRADFNGAVEISYKALGFSESNEKSWGAAIFKNGTEVVYTRTQAQPRDRIDKADSSSCTCIIACSTDDVFTLRIRVEEGNDEYKKFPIDGILVLMKVARITVT